MSLKQKCEAAPLRLIELAGTFTGARYRSQEAQTVTLSVPCVFAIAEKLGPAVLAPDGSHLGLERIRLIVGVKGSADANADLPDPATSHAANVDKIRDVLQVDTLVADLSGAVSEFTVIGAVPVDPPPADPEERNFVDYFAWELTACEGDI